MAGPAWPLGRIGESSDGWGNLPALHVNSQPRSTYNCWDQQYFITCKSTDSACRSTCLKQQRCRLRGRRGARGTPLGGSGALARTAESGPLPTCRCRSAFLAESVYDSVRAKIRRLQDDVKERDLRIQDLQQVGDRGRRSAEAGLVPSS